MKQHKIEEVMIQSAYLKQEMQLLIQLPSKYTPLTKHELLIASDGKDYFQYGRIGRVVDELIEDGEIDETIIVGVPYMSVKERRRMYHPDGDLQQAYMRFLAHELVPYMDKNYSTYAIGTTRGLIGDSLAATVSLQAAIKYPNCFGKVMLHSPYVNDAILQAVQQVDDPSRFSIYHVIGTGETEVQTTVDGIQDFLTPNRALHEVIQQKGFSYFYEEFNGNHTWKYWQQDVRRAILKSSAF